MKWRFTAVLLLCSTLCACSDFSVHLSDHKTPHFRTFAVVEHDHRPEATFDVRKREHTVMAEKQFFQHDKWNASFVAGRHRDHKWMSGILIQYSF